MEVEGGGPLVTEVVEHAGSNLKPLASGMHAFTRKSDGLKLSLKLETSLYTEFGDLAH